MDWARRHAVPLSGDEQDDLARLAVLDDVLRDVRVVYLGEEDHWVHEKYPYRRLFVRYLVSRGWRWIGEELGWSDGLRIDRYLAAGDESMLRRVATYGFRGDVRPDRDDRATGILADAADPVPTLGAEQVRFARFLRGLAEDLPAGDRLHFAGIDVDPVPAAGYRDVIDLAGEDLARAGVPVEPVHGESLEHEVARLADLARVLDERIAGIAALVGLDAAATVRRSVETMRASLAYQAIAASATDYRALRPALAARERLMVEHATWLLDQMGTADRLVLLGHNRHLSKDLAAMRRLGPGPPGGGLEPSVGTVIAHELGAQVFAIWLLHDWGGPARLRRRSRVAVPRRCPRHRRRRGSTPVTTLGAERRTEGLDGPEFLPWVLVRIGRSGRRVRGRRAARTCARFASIGTGQARVSTAGMKIRLKPAEILALKAAGTPCERMVREGIAAESA